MIMNDEKKDSGALIFMLLIMVIAGFMIVGWLNPPQTSQYAADQVDLPNDPYPNQIPVPDPVHYDIPQWDHMPLTYRFSEDNPCRSSQMHDFEFVFSELSRLTNQSVRFEEAPTSADVDLLLSCSDTISKPRYSKHYVEQTLGLADTQISEEGLITFSEITIAKNVGTEDGWYPITIMHETLHAFGFEHNETNLHIMNPYTDKEDIYDWYRESEELRNNIIHPDIIKRLIETYSA